MSLSQSLMTTQNMNALSRQFGISEDQAAAAMAALLPAFSSGLKHNAQTAPKAANFIQALSDGHHAKYIEEPDQAASAAGVNEGKAILGHLFGSKDTSRQVAHAAAAETGLGQKMIRKMLPVIASMVMGAVFKGLAGQRGGALGNALGGAVGGGLLGSLVESLAGGFLSGGQQALPNRRRSRRRARRSGGLGGLIGGVLSEALSGAITSRAPRKARQRRTPRAPRQTSSGSIFGDIFEPGPAAHGRSGSVVDQLLGN